MNDNQLEMFKLCDKCKGKAFIDKVKCLQCDATGWKNGKIALFVYNLNMELALGDKYVKSKEK